MFSTSPEKKLRKLYRKKLVSIARDYEARGVPFLTARAGDDDASWYVDGPIGEPELFEIEPDNIETDLRDLWESQGRPELAKLAPEMAKLARDLEVEEEAASDISPLMYQMY